MLLRLLLAIIVLFMLYYAYVWLGRLPPEKRRKAMLIGVLWTVIAAILLAVVTGKMHPLAMVFAGVLGIAKFGFTTIVRALPFIRFFGQNYNFGSPRFKTRFLQIEVNLQTGQFDGEVIDGPHAGKRIIDLTDEQLSELEAQYKEQDMRSYYLIRVIRQRMGSTKNGSHHGDKDQNYSSAGNPSIEEAKQILGITSDKPSKKEVIAAHRRLIQKLHPDRGGNDYLASRVNLAKDILLNHVD